jgi:hypothetical protein
VARLVPSPSEVGESPLPWRGRARVGAARRAGEEEEAVARLVPSASGGGQGWGLLSPLPTSPAGGGQGWGLLGDQRRTGSAKSSAASASL